MEEDQRLLRAQSHVDRGRAMVDRQRDFLRQLHEMDRPVARAQDLLDAPERSLKAYEDDLAALRRRG